MAVDVAPRRVMVLFAVLIYPFRRWSGCREALAAMEAGAPWDLWTTRGATRLASARAQWEWLQQVLVTTRTAHTRLPCTAWISRPVVPCRPSWNMPLRHEQRVWPSKPQRRSSVRYHVVSRLFPDECSRTRARAQARSSFRGACKDGHDWATVSRTDDACVVLCVCVCNCGHVTCERVVDFRTCAVAVCAPEDLETTIASVSGGCGAHCRRIWTDPRARRWAS